MTDYPKLEDLGLEESELEIDFEDWILTKEEFLAEISDLGSFVDLTKYWRGRNYWVNNEDTVIFSLGKSIENLLEFSKQVWHLHPSEYDYLLTEEGYVIVRLWWIR